uniref:Uncharacterized protein n=1 Tax=Setaria viridis TaxID=4556 RepID=A0A4U6V418_SETVI|nr:hypothetical protein SEVIR_5G433601v2 [Setaria viridis]
MPSTLATPRDHDASWCVCARGDDEAHFQIQISHPEPAALAFSEKKPRQARRPSPFHIFTSLPPPASFPLPIPPSNPTPPPPSTSLPPPSIHPTRSSLTPNPRCNSAPRQPRTKTLAEQPCPSSSRSSCFCSSPRPRPPAAPRHRERRLLGGGWCRWPRRRGSWARWRSGSTTRGGGLGGASSSARPAPAAAGTGTPASSRPAATPSTATSPTAPSA